ETTERSPNHGDSEQVAKRAPRMVLPFAVLKILKQTLKNNSIAPTAQSRRRRRIIEAASNEMPPSIVGSGTRLPRADAVTDVAPKFDASGLKSNALTTPS